MENPFLLTGYAGAEFFCDRKEELSILKNNVLHGENTLLLAHRRMGKSGLIQHLFHTLADDEQLKPIYFDIFHTQNQAEFVNILATGMARAFPERTKSGRKIWEFLKSFRPTVSFDRLSGMPEITIGYQTPQEAEVSLKAMLEFLEGQDYTTLVAIDEFQQISQYPETNTEALLRTYIQPLQHVRFIFSGSAPHLLVSMFQSPKRPFFSSTQSLYLGPITREAYFEFIGYHFGKAGKLIDEATLHWMAEFTWMHTYYVQWVCNTLFQWGGKNITLEKAQTLVYQKLEQQAYTFGQIRSLVTIAQWDLLKAIAKEQTVDTPNAKAFIQKYKLGTPAHVNRGLEALLTKELIIKEVENEKPTYRLADVLMSRWLQDRRL